MKKKLLLLSLLFIFVGPFTLFSEDNQNKNSVNSQLEAKLDSSALMKKAIQTEKQRNYRDALVIFKKLALSTDSASENISKALKHALECMKNLNKVSQSDGFREKLLEIHGRNWKVLQSIANTYIHDPYHWGYILAGNFERGPHRGGGEYVGTAERDRFKAIRIFLKAMPDAAKDNSAEEQYSFFRDFAYAVFYRRNGTNSWRLTALTDLEKIPAFNYQRTYGFSNNSRVSGAPVKEDGQAVFYDIPSSFNNAQNDGERWRWLLKKAKNVLPQRSDEVDLRFADFLYSQFGVQTILRGDFFRRFSKNNDSAMQSSPLAVRSLSDKETIAKLAVGIRKLSLPDEYNFIKIYNRLASPSVSVNEKALVKLAHIFQNRRQYSRAAEYWLENIEINGPGENNYSKKALMQIVAPRGKFMPSYKRPYNGDFPKLEFKFRNAEKVNLRAHRIKVGELIDDIKNYIKSNPEHPRWNKMNIGNIGYKIINKNEKKYLGEKAAEWKRDLKPKKNHFDKIKSIEVPILEPGAYLVEAQVENGNKSRIILWISSTVIVSKAMNEAQMYFLADAETGKPICNMNVDFFGYKKVYDKKKSRNFWFEWKNFSEKTDYDGLIFIDKDKIKNGYRWLLSCKNSEGGTEYLGFNGIWLRKYQSGEYNKVKAYGIRDRTVYRPGQDVNFKFWVRNAVYGPEDDNNSANFAEKAFELRIIGPRGKEVLKKKYKTDSYGGFCGKFNLEKNSKLGVYRLLIKNLSGSVKFRVEEYKKPEYEVKISSSENDFRLGDKIKFIIQADYYFGAPVKNAELKYKIYRYDYHHQWFPPMPWDWLYGKNSWKLINHCSSSERRFVSGARHELSSVPFIRHSNPPEIVADNVVDIGQDGKVEVEVDSSIAKKFFGDRDAEYKIHVEVSDSSGRTVTGNKSVIASCKPFRIYTRLNKGFYQVGDRVRVDVKVLNSTGAPVKTDGELRLVKLIYNKENGKIRESEIFKRPLRTDKEGEAVVDLTAAEKGQYKIKIELIGKNEEKVQDETLFSAYSSPEADDDFRFKPIEIAVDKMEYQPGDKVNFMINTEKSNSTVLLFRRPTNVYLKPQILRFNGKSIFQQIKIKNNDIPNIFIEALTVSDGQVYTVSKEIIVPPEKKVLNVDVKPNENSYSPNEKAKIKIKITDENKRPVEGTFAVSIYDKSLDYISGNMKFPNIKTFFWKWRRHFRAQGKDNFSTYFRNIMKKGEIPMRNIGIFSRLDITETEDKFGAGQRNKNMVLGVKAGAAPLRSRAESNDSANPSKIQNKIKIREKFADTAYWNGTLYTDKNGECSIEIDTPENLSEWKIKVWALAEKTRVGQGDAEFTTSKDFLVRLQAPRYFIENDEVTLSGIVHNYYSQKRECSSVLKLLNNSLSLLKNDEERKTFTVPGDGGEHLENWKIKAEKAGEGEILLKAASYDNGDAVKMSFPVYVHGAFKTESENGSLSRMAKNKKNSDKSDTEAWRSTEFEIKIPDSVRAEDTLWSLNYSPSLAAVIIESIPFLLEYPYSCTEQTLNRFLPALICRKTLEELKVDFAKLNNDIKKIKHEKETLSLKEKKIIELSKNPVFNKTKLNSIVTEGVEKLMQMQNADGGWGWFSGYSEKSFPHTTALIVAGLHKASENSANIRQADINSGIRWLEEYQNQQLQMLNNALKKRPKGNLKDHSDNIDAFVFKTLALTGKHNNQMAEFLYRDRKFLSVYSLCLLGRVYHKTGDKNKLKMILKNISQYLEFDEENKTAYLNLPNENYWWYWYGSDSETHAAYLKLLSEVKPQSKITEQIARYLVNSRTRGTHWKSTRDTAMCVDALADFVRKTEKKSLDLQLQVLIDGKVQKSSEINTKNPLSFKNTLNFTGRKIKPGKHKIKIRIKGEGELYYSSYLKYFTLEPFISATGKDIKISRNYYKIVEKTENETVKDSKAGSVEQKVLKTQRTALKNNASVKQGDIVEVELNIKTANDFEYLIFEDFKPAGFESVKLRSGYYNMGTRAYIEFRDRKVCFFVQNMPRGEHSISYKLRAEIPGKFSALPAKGSAMYENKLKSNSDEMKIKIIQSEKLQK